jgi:hypothetical protein
VFAIGELRSLKRIIYVAGAGKRYWTEASTAVNVQSAVRLSVLSMLRVLGAKQLTILKLS